jgi:uncharacterized membrane protein YcaP (DUF421 family)
MIEEWIAASWLEMGLAALSIVVVFAAVILLTRVAGLRSFSKMSSFDFAMTVAVGSIIASVAVTTASLASGLVALAALYLAQVLVATLRRRTGFEEAVDNDPVLLMANGRYLEENLKRTRVTKSDIRAKLREANALSFADVRAVVLETTGDVSVLHGDGELDPELFVGVRDGELLLDTDAEDR